MKSPAPHSPEVPTVAHVLSTFAYHVSCLAMYAPQAAPEIKAQRVRFGLGLGGYAEGCPRAYVNVTITPSGIPEGEHGGPWGVWAQVHFAEGSWSAFVESSAKGFPGQCHGNRHGAIEAYTRLCAPVIAWVSDYWARKEVAKAA
jgi:hypothetical protein